MEDRVLLGLTVLFCVSALASIVIYWAVICLRLYRNGSRFPTGFLPWQFFEVLRRYKELCRATSDSLSPFYIYLLIFFFSTGLGVVVVLGNIWKHTNHGL